MKKEFIEKVIRERCVDTAKYRYAVKEYPDHMDIVRLPLVDLGTTAAIDGWEIVHTVR